MDPVCGEGGEDPALRTLRGPIEQGPSCSTSAPEPRGIQGSQDLSL